MNYSTTSATSKTDIKAPERCAFWMCSGMNSPFKAEHARKAGETGRCRARKIPCLMETEGKCGMYLGK